MRQQQQQGHRTIQISCQEMNRTLSMFLLLLLLLLLLPLPLALSLPLALALPLPQVHRAGGREQAGYHVGTPRYRRPSSRPCRGMESCARTQSF
ncbi:unnamed protein product [Gadus morhua 'NCC']